MQETSNFYWLINCFIKTTTNRYYEYNNKKNKASTWSSSKTYVYAYQVIDRALLFGLLLVSCKLIFIYHTNYLCIILPIIDNNREYRYLIYGCRYVWGVGRARVFVFLCVCCVPMYINYSQLIYLYIKTITSL